MQKSEHIGTLAAALAKAQGQMGAAIKDASNPFFKSKYADLASVVDAIKAPLSSNGLAYSQATDIDETGGVIVETILLHESGEWLSSRLRMVPTKADPQGVGSCITYARRYGLQALVGIPADDDDGNASTGANREVEVNQGNVVAENRDDAGKQHRRAQSERPIENCPEAGSADDVLAWFHARVRTVPVPKNPDVQKMAGSLARGLKAAGLKDDERLDAYEWLTGERSGKDMAPAQLATLLSCVDVHQIPALQRCAAAMRPEKDTSNV